MKIFLNIALTAVLITIAAAREPFDDAVGRTDTIRVTILRAAADTSMALPHAIVYSRSVEAFTDASLSQRLPPDAYNYDRARACVVFTPLHALPEAADSLVVYIRYRYVPLLFKPSYSLRKMIVRTDSASVRAARIYTEQTSPLFGDFFGPELQKSGIACFTVNFLSIFVSVK